MSPINSIADVNALVTLVSTEFPIAFSAYSILKTIWLRTNPGKTEADFREYLRQTSQTNIDDSAAILKADGWIEDPPGSGHWHAPTAAAPPAV